MVIVNDTPYKTEENFGYPFRLDNFQKYAINAINNINTSNNNAFLRSLLESINKDCFRISI